MKILGVKPITPGLILSEGVENCLNEYKDNPVKQWEILLYLYDDPNLITTDLSPYLKSLVITGIDNPKSVYIVYYLLNKMIKFMVDQYTLPDKQEFGTNLIIMIFKLIQSSNGYYSYKSDHLDITCYYILEQCNIPKAKLLSIINLFQLV